MQFQLDDHLRANGFINNMGIKSHQEIKISSLSESFQKHFSGFKIDVLNKTYSTFFRMGHSQPAKNLTRCKPFKAGYLNKI